jgi:uncharacterized membrane protein
MNHSNNVKHYRFTVVVLFVLIVFFSLLATIDEFEKLDAENLWKMALLVVGLLGGLRSGKANDFVS